MPLRYEGVGSGFVIAKGEALKQSPSEKVVIAKGKALKQSPSEKVVIAKGMALKQSPSEKVVIAKGEALKQSPSEKVVIAKGEALKQSPSEKVVIAKGEALKQSPSEKVVIAKGEALKQSPCLNPHSSLLTAQSTFAFFGFDIFLTSLKTAASPTFAIASFSISAAAKASSKARWCLKSESPRDSVNLCKL